jgi:hypothetical protein
VRKTTTYLFVLGVAVVVTAALESSSFVALAQNSNTSMAATETSKKTTRRGRRKAAKKTDAAMTETTMAAQPMKRRTGRCDPMQQEQADLSGTYTGKARHDNNAPEDATLTITGNTFTMTSGSDTHSGRITAVTTCGYTAVTMMMGDLTPPAPSPNPPAALPAMSLRAKRVGNSLTLTSVPGEPKKVWFSTSGGSGMSRKHRSRKPASKAPATTTTTP